MLKSKRVVQGVYNTPLKKFKGHFDDYEVQDRKGQFAKQGQQDVLLKFSKVQVIETDSPYPYETAQLLLKFSDAPNSSWCVLEDSIGLVLTKNINDVSIDLIKGMDVEMTREDNFTFFTDKEGKAAKGTVWRVTSAGGKSAPTISAFDRALEILDGKTKGEFMGAAVTDPIVQNDKSLQNSILDGSFLNDDRVKAAFTLQGETYTKNK